MRSRHVVQERMIWSTAETLKTPLWKHQVEALEFIYDKPGAMLAMDMGTGKTLVAIARIASDPTMARILILCPLSVVGVWKAEFEKHAAREFHVPELGRSSVKQKTKKATEALADASTDHPVVIVINHEGSWRDPFGPIHNAAGRLVSPGLALGTEWDMVVVDESHRAKMPGGRFSMFLRRLRGKARNRLTLTGTPMPHSPLDVYAQYRFLDPEIYGTSNHAFKGKYAVMGGYERHEVIGFQNLDDLRKRFYSIAFEAKKGSVLDLPPVVHEERFCDLGTKAAKVYRDLEDQLYAEVDSGTITPANAMVSLLRLRQITGGYVKNDEGELIKLDDSKAKLLADVFKDLPRSESVLPSPFRMGLPEAPPERVVVFAQFTSDLRIIETATLANGWRYGEVSGRQKDLTDAGKFPDDVEVLGVQIQAGGVGIDLSRAHYAIYFSVGFSLGDYEQSLARLDRPGQDHKVTYIHLLARKTVDSVVYTALRKRSDVIKEVLNQRGGKRDE